VVPATRDVVDGLAAPFQERPVRLERPLVGARGRGRSQRADEQHGDDSAQTTAKTHAGILLARPGVNNWPMV
jgi:hypothetical protein